MKDAAWRYRRRTFFRHRWYRRLLLVLRWRHLRHRTYDLSHLPGYAEEDAGGPVQRDEALLLFALVRVLRPRVVVEIGFLLGRSALNFLLALPPSSTLYSFDIDPEAEAFARDDFPRDERFVFRRRSQDALEPADVDHRPVDLAFLDASHELSLNQATFARLKELLAEDGVVVVHDTGTWQENAFRPVHHEFAAGLPGSWLSSTEFVPQPDEREFVNWVREQHPEFHQLHLHSENTLRHGLTVLQRSRRLPVPAQQDGARAITEAA